MCSLLISAYFNHSKVVTLGEKSCHCIDRDWPGQESIRVTLSQQRCHYGVPGNSAHFPARKGYFSACNHQTPESLEMAQIWGVIFFLADFVQELSEKCEIFI